MLFLLLVEVVDLSINRILEKRSCTVFGSFFPFLPFCFTNLCEKFGRLAVILRIVWRNGNGLRVVPVEFLFFFFSFFYFELHYLHYNTTKLKSQWERV